MFQWLCINHEWTEATCTKPKTCSKCRGTEGSPLGHKWVDATCTEPKTCSVCGTIGGKRLDHSVKKWKKTKPSTCLIPGEQSEICTICGETIVKELPLEEHTSGDWMVIQEPTQSSDGVRTKQCTVCGAVVEEETFQMSAEELKDQYAKKCETYTYEQIARDPEKYRGKYAKLTGEVFQVMEGGDDYTLLVNITKQNYFQDDSVYVAYTKHTSDESRILEDDVVTMYGELSGTYTYETVMGAEVTIPLLLAEYIDVN